MRTRYKYTQEDLKFLQIYYPLNRWDLINERFPTLTKSSIYSFCYKNNIKSDKRNYEKLNNNFNNERWNNKEINVLKEYYHLLPINEIQKLLPNRTYNAIVTRAGKLNLQSYTHLNGKYTEEEVKFICNNWDVLSDFVMSKKLKKTVRSIKWKRCQLGLYRQTHDKLSYDDLNKYLRGNIWEWKKQSRLQTDNKCILTNSNNIDIHHIYSFNKILSEFIELYQIKVLPVNDYSKDTLNEITTKFNKFHNQYPLGVCVDKNIHKLFHKIYGKNNTPNQWFEFVRKFEKGEYTEYLSV